ncbi:MFS transporter [Sphaerisporangium rubeum]
MVVLDSTVVNIALPSVQSDLGLSDAARGWVVTAYALAFGGLLLIGGRVSDRFGQKRAFIGGLVGFAIASGIAGMASTADLLFVGRAAQGAFAAVLAPAALSLISTMFVEPRERGMAFGVFGALTGVGAAVGLLVGGLLTEYLSWNWCLLINLPIAALVLARAVLLPSDAPASGAISLDLPGTALSVLGMLAVVFSFSDMADHGWSDPVVLAVLAAGLLLMVGFVLHERRTTRPLLPLRVVSDRTRAGAFLVLGLPQISMFGFFLFLTYYLQGVLGYSPLRTGLAFLPLSLAIGIGSTAISGVLAPRLSPRAIIVPALLMMAAGIALMIGLGAGGPGVYLTRLLPAELLIGLGLGCVIAPAISMATAGVDPDDAGVASATVNVVQQLGGSVGTALLNTIATAAAGTYLATHPGATLRATVHGFDIALIVAVTVVAVTALIAAVMLRTRRPAVAPGPEASREGLS